MYCSIYKGRIDFGPLSVARLSVDDDYPRRRTCLRPKPKTSIASGPPPHRYPSQTFYFIFSRRGNFRTGTSPRYRGRYDRVDIGANPTADRTPATSTSKGYQRWQPHASLSFRSCNCECNSPCQIYLPAFTSPVHRFHCKAGDDKIIVHLRLFGLGFLFRACASLLIFGHESQVLEI